MERFINDFCLFLVMAEQPTNLTEETLEDRAEILSRRIKRSEEIYNNFIRPMFITSYVGLPFIPGYSIKNFYSLIGAGELPEGIALGVGALASLAAAASLVYSYAKGKWPFKFVEKLGYVPTIWFNGVVGPVFEFPQTRLIPSPILKQAKGEDENGSIVPAFVGGYTRELSSKDLPGGELFKIRTSEGLEGTISDVRYTYVPPNKEGAALFFWNHRGRRQIIDQFVLGTLSSEISRKTADQIASSEYLKNVIRQLNRNDSLYGKAGVKIVSIKLTIPDYDERSQRILSIAKEAEEQAKATQMLAGATRSSFETYKKIAEEISGMGCSLLPGDIVLKRMGGDEEQQMVGGAENKTAVIIRSPIPVIPQERINRPSPSQKAPDTNLKYHPQEPEE